jgi:hypothetical protein
MRDHAVWRPRDTVPIAEICDSHDRVFDQLLDDGTSPFITD